MTKLIKNRTSTVPVLRTIARIEQALAKAGVSSVVKEYGPQADVAALKFTIELDGRGPVTVRLPVDTRVIARMLFEVYMSTQKRRNSRSKHEKDFMEQAERTAWKLMQDWVEVQLSLIAMKQADFMAVFLPYLWDGRQTLFDRLLTDRTNRALLPMSSS